MVCRRCLLVCVLEAVGSRSFPPGGRGWSCREAPSRPAEEDDQT